MHATSYLLVLLEYPAIQSQVIMTCASCQHKNAASLSSDIWIMIGEYLEDPEDFFELRGTCSTTRSALTPRMPVSSDVFVSLGLLLLQDSRRDLRECLGSLTVRGKPTRALALFCERVGILDILLDFCYTLSPSELEMVIGLLRQVSRGRIIYYLILKSDPLPSDCWISNLIPRWPVHLC